MGQVKNNWCYVCCTVLQDRIAVEKFSVVLCVRMWHQSFNHCVSASPAHGATPHRIYTRVQNPHRTHTESFVSALIVFYQTDANLSMDKLLRLVDIRGEVLRVFLWTFFPWGRKCYFFWLIQNPNPDLKSSPGKILFHSDFHFDF